MAKSIKTQPCRGSDELLAAIAAKTVPRYVARVDSKATFAKYKTFANPGKEFAFAAEVADMRSATPGVALARVGWTQKWIKKKIGEEIGICIFDTWKAVPRKHASGKKDSSGAQTKPTVGAMNWDTLQAEALASRAFIADCWKEGAILTDESELGGLFEVLKITPVGAQPNVSDKAKAAQCKSLRDLLDAHFSANELYSGMGGTIQPSGELGVKEVTVNNNNTGFELTGENHELVSLGTLTDKEYKEMFPT